MVKYKNFRLMGKVISKRSKIFNKDSIIWIIHKGIKFNIKRSIRTNIWEVNAIQYDIRIKWNNKIKINANKRIWLQEMQVILFKLITSRIPDCHRVLNWWRSSICFLRIKYVHKRPKFNLLWSYLIFQIL